MQIRLPRFWGAGVSGAAIAIEIRIARSFCEGVNAGRYPAAGHEFMIAAHLRMRKIAREQREEGGTMSARGREKASAASGGVCDDAEKNASDTHENKNDYVPRRGRTCAACHARTHAHTRTPAYRRRSDQGEKEGGRRVQGCRTVTAMFCNLN